VNLFAAGAYFFLATAPPAETALPARRARRFEAAPNGAIAANLIET